MSNPNGAALNFNAANVKPDEGRVAIPAGWYNAKITASEMKPTKDNEGSYLQIEATIIDGAHAGRKLFDRMNLANKSQVAVEIAQARLSAYCHATNVINLQHTTQLHEIPFTVKVRLKPADGQYDESNEISAVKAIGQAAGAGPVVGAPAGAAAGGPAWLNPAAAAAPAAAVAAAVAAAPAAPVPAPVVAAPVRTMTALAQGASYETFTAAGWTDEQMIAQGYMTVGNPAPATPAAPVPAAPVPAAASAPTASGSAPPWAR